MKNDFIRLKIKHNLKGISFKNLWSEDHKIKSRPTDEIDLYTSTYGICWRISIKFKFHSIGCLLISVRPYQITQIVFPRLWTSFSIFPNYVTCNVLNLSVCLSVVFSFTLVRPLFCIFHLIVTPEHEGLISFLPRWSGELVPPMLCLTCKFPICLISVFLSNLFPSWLVKDKGKQNKDWYAFCCPMSRNSI